MPVETLSPAHSGLKGAPFGPAHSGLKGALFLLRPRSPRRRLSAVERLEADKVKYVKSQQVALTRQAPVIRKALRSPGHSCPASRQKLSPRKHTTTTTGIQRSSARETGRRGSSLDLGLLSDLISDVSDGSAPSPLPNNSGIEKAPPTEPKASAGLRLGLLGSSSSSQATPPPLPPRPPQATPPPLPPRPLAAVVAMAIRRVDVRPQAEARNPGRRPLQPRPCPPSPSPSRGSAHRKLQRSQSDLSERFSRASAERERFFNLCGLEAEPCPASPRSPPSPWPSSDSTSLRRQRSASVKSEEREEEGRASERAPYGISVIERNARVIKWLYGLRQAREEP